MSETIAVFIDGDNISPKDIEPILTEICDYGKIIIKRIYLDWTQTQSRGWLQATRDYGLEPIQCDLIKGKNSTDIKLTVDVMKTLYNVNHISLFYLVTQDGDFRHIIPEIKINNRNVNVIGKNISKALGASCDNYTSLDVINQDLNVKNKKTPKEDREIKVLIKKYREEIEKLLESNSCLSFSLIKDTLHRKYRLDHRAFGFKQFSKFMAHYFQEYSVQKTKEGCFLVS